MSRTCLLCNENETPGDHKICDPCFDNAGEMAERNAELYAAVWDLLRIARSAAVAFEEHLSVLHDERMELVGAGIEGEDLNDIDDRIGNYEHLLAGHKAVLDKIPAR